MRFLSVEMCGGSSVRKEGWLRCDSLVEAANCPRLLTAVRASPDSLHGIAQSLIETLGGFIDRPVSTEGLLCQTVCTDGDSCLGFALEVLIQSQP